MSELKEDIVKEYTKNRGYIFLELIKYCKNNNIKLLRIPYWEYKEDNYKEILFYNIINV